MYNKQKNVITWYQTLNSVYQHFLVSTDRFFYVISASNYVLFKRDLNNKIICLAMPSPKLTKVLKAQTDIKYNMQKIFSDEEMTALRPEEKEEKQKDEDSEDIEELMANLQEPVNM